jgi:hypothetical protein
VRGQSGNWLSYRDRSIGSEEFLNQIVEVLDITLDGRSKGMLKKKVGK